MTVEDLEAMLAQHAWSTFNTFQAFTPLMLVHAWGRVLVVSSLAVNRPPARMAAYAAAEKFLAFIVAEVIRHHEAIASGVALGRTGGGR